MGNGAGPRGGRVAAPVSGDAGGRSGAAGPAPTWTVVVPTHGRPEDLSRCLAALQRLDVDPRDAEVVVVDDGGTPAAAPVVAAVPGPLPVRVHRQDNAGPASARNTGARLARGRRLAFTDDDCAPARGWLAALGAALDAEPAALVGGPTVNALHDDPWAEATQQLVSHLTGDPDAPAFLPTCNLAVARDAFVTSGGFDESFPSAAGEDRAFCDAWQDAGRPLRWCADARVEHAHHLSARRFWRQHAGYGRAARAVHASRRAAGRRDGRPAGPAFHVALLARPVRTLPPGRRAGVVGRLLVAQAATAVGWASAARPSSPVADVSGTG